MERRIWIVGEDKGLVEGAQQVLMLDGYHIWTFESESEATRLLQESSELPYLMILIHTQDSNSSLEFFHLARRMIPAVVILAWYPGVSHFTTYGKLGADEYMIPPFKPDDLLKMADTHFRRLKGE